MRHTHTRTPFLRTRPRPRRKSRHRAAFRYTSATWREPHLKRAAQPPEKRFLLKLLRTLSHSFKCFGEWKAVYERRLSRERERERETRKALTAKRREFSIKRSQDLEVGSLSLSLSLSRNESERGTTGGRSSVSFDTHDLCVFCARPLYAMVLEPRLSRFVKTRFKASVNTRETRRKLAGPFDLQNLRCVRKVTKRFYVSHYREREREREPIAFPQVSDAVLTFGKELPNVGTLTLKARSEVRAGGALHNKHTPSIRLSSSCLEPCVNRDSCHFVVSQHCSRPHLRGWGRDLFLLREP